MLKEKCRPARGEPPATASLAARPSNAFRLTAKPRIASPRPDLRFFLPDFLGRDRTFMFVLELRRTFFAPRI